MDQTTATYNSIEPADRFTKTNTIYDVSIASIIVRNFLAGLSRALGSITIYVVFLIITYSLFVKYALPEIQPFITEYRQAIDSITKLNQATTNPGSSINSQQYQQFLRDLNNSLPINR